MHPEIARLRLDLPHDADNPLAWRDFFDGAWALSRATAQRHPQAFDSWRRRAFARALGLPIVAVALGCAPLSLSLWSVYGWQQLDLYLHLGLNKAGHECAPWDTLPPATECSLVHAYAGAALLCGCARPRAAFALGTATDVLDGLIARRTGTATILGAYLDAEYDGLLWVAAARAARRGGGLTAWGAGLLSLRMGVSAALGFAAFFTAPQPMGAGSTYAGKAAGVVQTLLLWDALGPRSNPCSTEVGRRRTVFAALATSMALVAQARRFQIRA